MRAASPWRCDRYERIWRSCGEHYAACNTVQGGSTEGRTDLCRLSNGILTVIKYQGEILGPTIRPYTGAVGPGLPPDVWQSPSSWGKTLQADPGGWRNWYHWPPRTSDLNLIECLWDIMLVHLMDQIAPQTIRSSVMPCPDQGGDTIGTTTECHFEFWLKLQSRLTCYM